MFDFLGDMLKTVGAAAGAGGAANVGRPPTPKPADQKGPQLDLPGDPGHLMNHWAEEGGASASAMTKAAAEGKLDATEIRKQMFGLPKEAREAALADLGPDERAKVEMQLSADGATVKHNAVQVAALKKVDPKDPKALEVALGAMRKVPPEERAAIIASLPPDQAAFAGAAFATIVSQEAMANLGRQNLEKAAAEGKLDENEIRRQMHIMPEAERAAALAKLDPATRKQVEAQMASDAAAVKACGPAMAKLRKIDPNDPKSMDAAVAAMRDVPLEALGAIIDNLPDELKPWATGGSAIAAGQAAVAGAARDNLEKAAAEGKLDQNKIHEQLAMIPKELRDAQLAKLDPETRKKVSAQLSDDNKVQAKHPALAQKLAALKGGDARALAEARIALQELPVADRVALMCSFTDGDPHAMGLALGQTMVADVNASLATYNLTHVAEGEKLDEHAIRKNLRLLPADMRKKALADMPADVRDKVAAQMQVDDAAVQANLPAAQRLHQIDFSKPGSQEAAMSLLAHVPADQRAALIETLPDGVHEFGGLAIGGLAAREAQAEGALAVLKMGGEKSMPDNQAIETSLCFMDPIVRENTLARLSPEVREAVQKKIQEGQEKAAHSAELLGAAVQGDKVDRLAVHRALKELPPWEQARVLAGLSDEARAAAEQAAADADKMDKTKKALEAAGDVNLDDDEQRKATLETLKNVPPYLYDEMVGALPEGTRGTLGELESIAKNRIENAADKPRTGMFACGEERNEELERELLDTPPCLREKVVGEIKARDAEYHAGLCGGDVSRTLDASVHEVNGDEARWAKQRKETGEKVSKATAQFEAIAKEKAPAEELGEGEDEGKWLDAKKQRADKMKKALELIPYKEREKALESMDPEARAVAEQAMATKKSEMKAKAEKLFNAMNAGLLDGGKDISAIHTTLAGLTRDEVKELEEVYGDLYRRADDPDKGRDLEADLKAEFQDASALDPTKAMKDFKMDREFINAVFCGDTAEQKAIALQLAARGSSSTDCTDEALIHATLESITDPEERKEVLRIFQERQEKAGASITTVQMMLRDEMVTGAVDRDDYDYKRAVALLEGDPEKAKAVQMDEAMDPGILGNVSVRDVTYFVPVVALGAAVLDKAGVVDIDRKLSEPDVAKVDQLYSDCSSQEERDKISGKFEDIAGKPVWEVARERCYKPIDPATGKPLDVDGDLVEAAAKNDRVGVRAATWAKKSLDTNADEMGMNTQLEGGSHKEVYDRLNEKYGEGFVDRRSAAVMNKDELAVQKELVDSGKVKPETGVVAACPKNTLSWDLADIEKHLKDPKTGKLRSQAEMASIKAALCASYDIKVEELDELIDAKLGGKDAFRLKQDLKGAPTSFSERMDRMKEEHDFNRMGLGNLAGKMMADGMSEAGGATDAQMKRMQNLWNGFKDLAEKKERGDVLTPEEQKEFDAKSKEFEEIEGNYGTNVKSFQASRESVTNDLTTIGAAVAGTVVTVLSAGTLGPVVAAGLGALAAGAATMGGKEVMLGDSYNTHDQGKDALQTVGNTAIAMGTAGLAPGIDKIAGKLGSFAGELGTAGVKGFISGGVNGLASGTLGVALDESTLQGKMDVGASAKKVAVSTISGAASGTVTETMGKGLDKAGLHAADATKTNWSRASNIGNKALSQLGGDFAGHMVDPGNWKGDVLGDFIKKEALSAPNILVGALVEEHTAKEQHREAQASNENRPAAPAEHEASTPAPAEHEASTPAPAKKVQAGAEAQAAPAPAPAPRSPEAQQAMEVAGKLFDVGPALEKVEVKYHDGVEVEYRLPDEQLTPMQRDMRKLAEGTDNQEGDCTKASMRLKDQLAAAGVEADVMNYEPQREKGEKTDRFGHRYAVSKAGVIMDPTFSQMLTLPPGFDATKPLPSGKYWFEPFAGSYDDMRVRVKEAMDAGLMPEDSGKPVEEVLAKRWGVKEPGADGKPTFVEDAKKFGERSAAAEPDRARVEPDRVRVEPDRVRVEPDRVRVAKDAEPADVERDGQADVEAARVEREPVRVRGPEDATAQRTAEREVTAKPVEPAPHRTEHDDGHVSHRELDDAELADLHVDIDGAENTKHIQERAKKAEAGLSDGERAAYQGAMEHAQTNLQKEMIERSLAAGNPVTDVVELAKKIGPHGDKEILDLLTGKSIVQVSNDSCVPASMQIAIAKADPVFALKMAEDPDLMAKVQRLSLERHAASFPQRGDTGALPPDVQQAVERNPRLGEILADPSYYHEQGSTSGATADQARDMRLKDTLDQTTGVEHKVQVTAGDHDAGDGSYGDKLPHDHIQAQLDKTGAVPIAVDAHARVISRHFVNSKGEDCYVVRDPHEGTKVMTAAELDAMPGVFVVHGEKTEAAPAGQGEAAPAMGPKKKAAPPAEHAGESVEAKPEEPPAAPPARTPKEKAKELGLEIPDRADQYYWRTGSDGVPQPVRKPGWEKDHPDLQPLRVVDGKVVPASDLEQVNARPGPERTVGDGDMRIGELVRKREGWVDRREVIRDQIERLGKEHNLTPKEVIAMDRKVLAEKYPNLAEQVEYYKAAQAEVIRVTEKYGEQGARVYAENRFGGEAQEVYNGFTSGQFDQVIKVPKGAIDARTGEVVKEDRYIVVEAKGGASPLGYRIIDGKEYQQGTKKYFEAICKEMRGKLERDPAKLFPPEVRANPELLAAKMEELRHTLDGLEKGAATGENLEYVKVGTAVFTKLAKNAPDHPVVSEFDMKDDAAPAPAQPGATDSSGAAAAPLSPLDELDAEVEAQLRAEKEDATPP